MGRLMSGMFPPFPFPCRFWPCVCLKLLFAVCRENVQTAGAPVEYCFEMKDDELAWK